MLDVCILTYNPRYEILRLAVDALARQQGVAGQYQVLLIDNASKPSVARTVLAPLVQAGVPCRMIQEPMCGVSRARTRALRETCGEWILFVDDDNELDADYIATGLSFIHSHPTVGCFGGKLLLAPNLDPPDWAVPFLPYLGIKDEGNERVVECREDWSRSEPPGGGAWVRRDVLDEYVRKCRFDPRALKLGRAGALDLASREDTLMMRGAYNLGLMRAYLPELTLVHHLDPRKFRLSHLLPLMFAYGRSSAILEQVSGRLDALACYLDDGLFKADVDWLMREEAGTAPFRAGQVAWAIGARLECAKIPKSDAGV